MHRNTQFITPPTRLSTSFKAKNHLTPSAPRTSPGFRIGTKQPPVARRPTPHFLPIGYFFVHIRLQRSAFYIDEESGYATAPRRRRQRLRTSNGKHLAKNGHCVMSERTCGNCYHFSSARSCYDKPTWGHCTWPTDDAEDTVGPDGRFTWADDTCEHYEARQQIIAQN